MTATTGFAQNLIYIRQHYGVTQEVLAEQLGVSRQTVSKWEAGINFPETDKLLLLCDLYHTNLDDLMRGSVKIANVKDTELYDTHMNRFCRGIVAGIVIIICGVALFMFLEGLGLNEKLCIAAMLSGTVVGAVLIVVSGLTHAEFKRRHPDLDPSYPAEVLDTFGKRFIIRIAGGIALILVGVILYVTLSPGDAEGTLLFGVIAGKHLALTLFLLVVALGAGTIVYAGMQKSKYDLTEFTSVVAGGPAVPPGAVIPQEIAANTLKRNNISGALCGIIMLIATIVFFVWGFSGNGFPLSGDDVQWSGFMYSWIAFPIGGMLCGVVAIITNALFRSNEELLAEAKKENPWARVEGKKGEEETGDSPFHSGR